MIRRKRADTYVYRLYCDKCGAEMRATAVQLPADPPVFPHECANPNCGMTTQVKGRRYPYIDTIEIEEEVAQDNQMAPDPDTAA